jgi:hypothetical protein
MVAFNAINPADNIANSFMLLPSSLKRDILSPFRQRHTHLPKSRALPALASAWCANAVGDYFSRSAPTAFRPLLAAVGAGRCNRSLVAARAIFEKLFDRDTGCGDVGFEADEFPRCNLHLEAAREIDGQPDTATDINAARLTPRLDRYRRMPRRQRRPHGSPMKGPGAGIFAWTGNPPSATKYDDGARRVGRGPAKLERIG